MSAVYVVSEIIGGVSSIIGVFQKVSWESLEKRFPPHDYFIHEFEIEKNLKNHLNFEN